MAVLIPNLLGWGGYKTVVAAGAVVFLVQWRVCVMIVLLIGSKLVVALCISNNNDEMEIKVLYLLFFFLFLLLCQ